MIETLLIVLVIVVGWYWFEGRWDRRLFAKREGRICENLQAPDAKAFLESHADTQVLDVRSDAEFARGALPNATHISFGDADFADRVSKLDKARPVLVYCAGGYRSRKAVEVLLDQNFTSIHHLHRGYMSWPR